MAVTAEAVVGPDEGARGVETGAFPVGAYPAAVPAQPHARARAARETREKIGEVWRLADRIERTQLLHLKDVRAQRRMSQRQAAAASGVARAAIIDAEHGRLVSLSAATRLAVVLNVPLEALIGAGATQQTREVTVTTQVVPLPRRVPLPRSTVTQRTLPEGAPRHKLAQDYVRDGVLPPLPPDDLYVFIWEASKLSGIKQNTLRKALSRGRLATALRVGPRAVALRWSEVAAYNEETKRIRSQAQQRRYARARLATQHLDLVRQAIADLEARLPVTEAGRPHQELEQALADLHLLIEQGEPLPPPGTPGTTLSATTPPLSTPSDPLPSTRMSTQRSQRRRRAASRRQRKTASA